MMLIQIGSATLLVTNRKPCSLTRSLGEKKEQQYLRLSGIHLGTSFGHIFAGDSNMQVKNWLCGKDMQRNDNQQSRYFIKL